MTPILITGATGTLGRAFGRLCHERHLVHRATSRAELDITDAASVDRALQRHQPWLVINAAGGSRVDGAEYDPARCHREHVLGAQTLARACARDRVRFVTFSSDLVFDGAQREPYDEHARPAPLGVYGTAKLEAEARVREAHPGALVIRTGALFGPWDDRNFVTVALRELAAGRDVRAADDTFLSPTYVPDLVHAVLDLALDREAGIWHLATPGVTSWAGLARAAAALAGLEVERVIPVPAREIGWRARRPRFSALRSSRGASLTALDAALRHYSAAVKGPPC